MDQNGPESKIPVHRPSGTWATAWSSCVSRLRQAIAWFGPQATTGRY
jgi:hypothetical protein